MCRACYTTSKYIDLTSNSASPARPLTNVMHIPGYDSNKKWTMSNWQSIPEHVDPIEMLPEVAAVVKLVTASSDRSMTTNVSNNSGESPSLIELDVNPTITSTESSKMAQETTKAVSPVHEPCDTQHSIDSDNHSIDGEDSTNELLN